MRKFWIPILLCFPSCGGSGSLEPVAVATAEELRILETVVNAWAADWVDHCVEPPCLLVLNMTLGAPFIHLDREQASQLGWGSAESWEKLSQMSAGRLEPLPDLALKFTIVTVGETRQGFIRRRPDGEWDGERAGHPGSAGYFLFHTPAISSDGSEALVVASFIPSILRSSRNVFRLVKVGGEWRVMDRAELLSP